MKLSLSTQRAWPLAACITLLLLDAGVARAQTTLPDNASVRESFAFHVGSLAYIYGYPMVEMYKQMHNETNRVSADQPFYAPLNHFYYFDGLLSASKNLNLRAPTSYMLYFGGWCDLSKEPVIVHNPNTDGRYYTMVIADLNMELMHLGRRTIGTEEHHHGLVGPDWKGALPDAVRPIPMRSNQIRILGRLLVRDGDDLQQAKALLKQFWVSPLSEWRRSGPTGRVEEPVRTKAIDPMDNLAFFQYLNQGLRTNPQRREEAALMAQFDAIGIGPFSEFKPDQLDPAIEAGLTRAIGVAKEMIETTSRSVTTPVNGWMSANKAGRYGFDYLQRAAAMAKGGFGALPEESLYATSLFDNHVVRLNGEHRYSMTFAKGQLPPVKDFWTLSTYRSEDSRFEQNAINRYSIGSLSPDLKYGPDGSLTIYFQHDRPAEGTSNWLPTPAGNFFIMIRQYEPLQALLDGSYRLPPILRVED